MKNIKLIAFLFNLIVGSFWGGICVLQAQVITLRTDYHYDESLIISAKLKLPFLEVTGAAQCIEKSQYNYGLSFHTEKWLPQFPVVIKAGKLSAQGSISSLNSPELGNASPWAKQVNISVLSSSLPSSTSFSKPDSLFIQAGYSSKNSFVQKLSTAFFYDTETLTTSLNFNSRLFDAAVFSMCLTGGMYPVIQKDSTSWFSNPLFFHSGKHLCAGGQFCISSKNWGSLFISNLYESPEGKIQNVFRTENYFKFRHFSFNFSGYYNPHMQIITSSGKNLSPKIQIKNSGQYQFITGIKSPLIIKSGFGSLFDINLDEQNHSVKTCGNIKLTGEKNIFTISTKLNFSAENQSDSININFSTGSIETSVSSYINSFKPQLKTKFSFEPDSKHKQWTLSEKIGLSCSWYDKKGILSIGGNADVTLLQKNGEHKKSYSAGGYIQLKLNWFCLKVDVGI